MLDIHVLTVERQRQDWLQQCVASIQRASEGLPVHLHLVPGVEGHIGEARRLGFAAGTAEWVSWVDADDWLAPDAIGALWPLRDRQGVCGRAINVREDGSLQNAPRGLVIARREQAAAFDWSAHPTCGTCAFRDSLEAVQTNHPGYFRRRYESAARRLRGGAQCG